MKNQEYHLSESVKRQLKKAGFGRDYSKFSDERLRQTYTQVYEARTRLEKQIYGKEQVLKERMPKERSALIEKIEQNTTMLLLLKLTKKER